MVPRVVEGQGQPQRGPAVVQHPRDSHDGHVGQEHRHMHGEEKGGGVEDDIVPHRLHGVDQHVVERLRALVEVVQVVHVAVEPGEVHGAVPHPLGDVFPGICGCEPAPPGRPAAVCGPPRHAHRRVAEKRRVAGCGGEEADLRKVEQCQGWGIGVAALAAVLCSPIRPKRLGERLGGRPPQRSLPHRSGLCGE